MAMMINADVCTACGDCETTCPSNAISPKKGVYYIDPALCNECEGIHDSPKCLEGCFEEDCIVPAE
nr:4Fe-4S binding protein [uncultured Cohaesibacter sp.]